VADTGCSNITNQFNELNKDLKKLIKAPLVVMHHMQRLAKCLTDAMQSPFDAIMKEIDKILADLPTGTPLLSDIQKAINNLANCAAVAGVDSAKLKMMSDIVGKCKDASDVPKFVKDYLTKKIKDGAMAAINDAIQGSVVGMINKAGDAYNDMLKASGITDGLNKVDQLVSCVKSMCDSAAKVAETLEKYQEKLGGLSADNILSDATNKLCKGASSAQLRMVYNSGQKINSAKKIISEFSWT
jgi:hypothetical protein